MCWLLLLDFLEFQGTHTFVKSVKRVQRQAKRHRSVFCLLFFTTDWLFARWRSKFIFIFNLSTAVKTGFLAKNRQLFVWIIAYNWVQRCLTGWGIWLNKG